MVSQIAGLPQNAQVEIHPLGQTGQDSLADRLLPILILMSIMLGGVMVPALSMITEKQSRTLLALNVTPARLGEVFAAKIPCWGTAMGACTGVVTLVLNRAFGSQPLLLVFVMLLGALAASSAGYAAGGFIEGHEYPAGNAQSRRYPADRPRRSGSDTQGAGLDRTLVPNPITSSIRSWLLLSVALAWHRSRPIC